MPLLIAGPTLALGTTSLVLLFSSWLTPPQLRQLGLGGRRFVSLVAGTE